MAKANDCMLESDRRLLAMRFEEKRLKWEKTRRRGIVFYVLVWWILIRGGILTAVCFFLDFYPDRQRIRGAQALLAWAVGLGIATLIGVWDWYSNEKRYRKKAL